VRSCRERLPCKWPGSVRLGKYISFHDCGLLLRMPALCSMSMAAPTRCGVLPKM